LKVGVRLTHALHGIVFGGLCKRITYASEFTWHTC